MLINCVAYQDGLKIAEPSIHQISDYVTKPHTFIWVALKDADSTELQQMKEEFELHELAVEDAQHGHQRPKVEEYGDSIFAVIQLIEIVNSELHVGEVDVFVGRNYVLSIRNRSQQNFLGVRARCEREQHLLKLGSGFVFYALIDAIVDRYFPIVDALETELEEIEEKIFNQGSARSNIERLYALKRKVQVLKHAVAPLLDAVGKLQGGGRVPNACSDMQVYFRDVYDHLGRINSSVDAIRDTIATAMQVNLSMVTIEEGEVNKRLAAWAGIFAVATALAGIWGMNFEVMPELKWEYGYPAALLAIAGAAGILYWRFRKSGWL